MAEIFTDDSAWADQVWRKGLAPEPQLTVSEWADRNRILPPTSAEPGAWRTDRVPYLCEIMDCLSTSSAIERVVFMKGAQLGATECGLNWIGYVIAHAPGLMLAVMPSIDMVRRNSRTRIDPLIEATPALRKRVAPPNRRESGNTVNLKSFPGGQLVLTGANSATGLRSTPARYIFLDEVDGFPADADGEGDPVALAIQRTVTFRGRRKIFLASTPTLKGISRIEKAYEESDKRRFYIPCPECGTFQFLEWSHVTWPKNKPQEAHYACKECGGVIEEQQKPALLAAGEWRATAKGDGRTAGFHLSALYSPFETWGEIATEHGQVYRDPARLQSWVNLKLGETWEDQVAAPIEADGFLTRLEDWGELLPENAAVLTASVDTQDDRLEMEIVAWGRDEECWSVDYQVLWGDPAGPELWRILDQELLRRFPHARAVPDLGLSAVAIDSGGHHTAAVMKFCADRQGRRVWAIKGRGGPGVPPWPKRPPRVRRGRPAPLFIVGVDGLKEGLHARLRLDESGPGFCHFPQDRDLDYFRQLTSERPLRRYVRGVAVREWRKDPGVRNEAFDCRVYATAALHGLYASGLRLGDMARRIEEAPLRKNRNEPINDVQQTGSVNMIRSSWLEQNS